MSAVTGWTVETLVHAIARRKISPVEATRECLNRIERLDGLGLPALAVPCGLSSDGRPLALQIVGRAFDEATVLRVGHAYQRVTAWHLEPPRFSGRGGPVIG